MTKGFPFVWKIHLETKYEGYRLSVKVDPDSEAPEDKGAELAAEVLRGLRNAGLLAVPSSAARTSVLSTLPTRGARQLGPDRDGASGAFTLPIRSFTNAISSGTVHDDPRLEARTTASTRSPHFSSGRPITAQSCTAGCCISACSTSAE